MDPSLRLPYTLPPDFEWANSAHTDFREAHIIVLRGQRWVAVAMPRQRAPGWEACTGMYRRIFKVAAWQNLEREAEAVRWIATWVCKYERQIQREAGAGVRHPPAAPRYVLERMKHGR
ncbi:hypothetical protein [Lysobacter enzymogenes]|uniref:hypothetical protein n=1 Tax=Lysobacter enzymogenes TaxID=69 RepID=UPI001A95A9A4|nr:hypothetical protein [Lysobacter enzymogenes]QQP96490.1 hypothetical protein JHW38_00070 [Lysobacter enzymogenes]QQP96558.1 hypothetical protein JHW38_00420 [Lysobacter enzymogenes]